MNSEDLALVTSTCRDWLVEGPLAPILPSLITTWRRQRYSDHTVAAYLRAMAHMAFWMKAEDLSLQALDKALIRRFLDQHLPVCACPVPHQSRPADAQAAANHLLRLLRPDLGIADKVPEPSSPVAVELRQFRFYLEETCGLAATTCDYRDAQVREFLTGQFGDAPVDLRNLTPEAIEAFVMSFAGHWTPASLHVLCGSLSSYLRFKALSGERVEALRAALPKPVVWRRTALPKVLSEAQLGLFLNAFDRSTPIGRRDYAVARCLVDLGLRGQEVANLTLDDLDWHSGTVTIRASKNQRVQQLPLPTRTGEALADYLREGRPATGLRSVFVRHRAPAETPLGIPAIRNIANRAWMRCGLYGPFHNTHVLRHTLASRLQKAGTPLKEIADVLRHQDLDTTAGYIRVDREHLRSAALPWPGRHP
jgi:integrase/recombinase XerD